MWLIAGLGNPGKKYERTRHNVGFMVAELLAQRWGVDTKTKKFASRFGRGTVSGSDALIALPQTYMNLSGDAVQPMAAYFRVPIERIVVVHDELDLPFGVVRAKGGGGHAGHNGLRSLKQRLGGGDFPRVRVGVGRPEAGNDVVGHVLGGFNTSEARHLEAVIERAADIVEQVMKHGVGAAMNRVNGLPPVC